MGTMAPAICQGEEAKIVALADDLSRGTPKVSVSHTLNLLQTSLVDPTSRQRVASIFLRAGGLSPLIHHFGGSSSSFQTIDSATRQTVMSAIAGTALKLLLCSDWDMKPVMEVSTAIVMPLVNILRAGELRFRCVAAETLGHLITAHPSAARTMAEAGAMELVLSLYIKVQALPLPKGFARVVTRLAFLLATSDAGALSQLVKAIRAPDALQAFAAVVILQDTCLKKPGHNLPGVVDALVAALNHKSPFCVAAAAGALIWIGDCKNIGPRMIVQSDTVAALIAVLKSKTLAADLENEMAIFRRPVSYFNSDCPDRDLRFNDPTALAVYGLSTLYSLPMLYSFNQAGGVVAVTQLLLESVCPMTTGYAAELINRVLASVEPFSFFMCDEFFLAGLCLSALAALKIKNMRAGAKVMCMLSKFVFNLSDWNRPAALVQVVAGRGVDLIVPFMVTGSIDTLSCGMRLVAWLSTDSTANDRIYSERIGSQLIHCLGIWLPQAEGKALTAATMLLQSLLSVHPDPIPRVISANVTPALVRVLREVLSHPESYKAAGPNISSRLISPLTSLSTIMRLRTDSTAAWMPLINAGIIQLLCDLIGLRSVELIQWIMFLANNLMMATPPGGAQAYLGNLAHMIAGLIKETPPFTPGLAADTLYFMAFNHEELLDEYRSWGMGPSLEHLTKHEDPNTVFAVKQLLLIINNGKKGMRLELRCLLHAALNG